VIFIEYWNAGEALEPRIAGLGSKGRGNVSMHWFVLSMVITAEKPGNITSQCPSALKPCVSPLGVATVPMLMPRHTSGSCHLVKGVTKAPAVVTLRSVAL
jgi:hypothetical protein